MIGVSARQHPNHYAIDGEPDDIIKFIYMTQDISGQCTLMNHDQYLLCQSNYDGLLQLWHINDTPTNSSSTSRVVGKRTKRLTHIEIPTRQFGDKSSITACSRSSMSCVVTSNDSISLVNVVTGDVSSFDPPPLGVAGAHRSTVIADGHTTSPMVYLTYYRDSIHEYDLTTMTLLRRIDRGSCGTRMAFNDDYTTFAHVNEMPNASSFLMDRRTMTVVHHLTDTDLDASNEVKWNGHHILFANRFYTRIYDIRKGLAKGGHIWSLQQDTFARADFSDIFGVVVVRPMATYEARVYDIMTSPTYNLNLSRDGGNPFESAFSMIPSSLYNIPCHAFSPFTISYDRLLFGGGYAPVLFDFAS
jgi:hypothetical protein